ncbi:MAG: extracellular solute-binding protein [Candidatus Bathyarchaeia archaeon]
MWKRAILILIVWGVLFGIPVYAKKVTINFAAWTYDLTRVKQHLQLFSEWIKETHGIDVDIKLTDYPFGQFDVNIAINFVGGSPFDVFYTSDHWLAKWRTAGWIVPIEDYMSIPEKDDLIPYVQAAFTLDGKLYALPYYADVMIFVYNTKMLQKAGFKSPPTTWQEVFEYSRHLKEQGIVESPFWAPLKAVSWFEEVIFAMLYGFGGDLFDDVTLAVKFETGSGPFYDVIAWLKQAVETGIMSPRCLEMTAVDVQEAVKAGDAAFAIVPGYMLAEFNLAPGSKVRGEIDVALMPGTGVTTGFARGYVMSPAAVRDPDKRAVCVQLMKFLGGKVLINNVETYHIAKSWSLNNALGFAYRSLWDDPDVAAFFRQLGNLEVLKQQKENALLKDGLKAPWYPEWIRLLRSEIQAAILGQKTIEATLTALRQAWIELAQK